MAMENKRIIQLNTERTTLGDDDYTIVDSETNGTAKYRLSRLKETDTTLSVSGMAADAAATGQAISDEAEARESADTAIEEDIDDLKSATESLENQMTQKADIDGAYEDLTVGTAEAVLSEKFTADFIPYHFRKTPYGDRLKEKIIGGTVAWNQLTRYVNETRTINGVTYTVTDGVRVSYSGTATETSILHGFTFEIFPDHIYLIFGGKSISEYATAISSSSWYKVPTDYGSGSIGKAKLYNRIDVAFVVLSGATVSGSTSIQFYDLTAMFGSTIADYIYNLEQTTEGAGVALFRELFPKDYYEYDAGSLQSVSGLQSHDEVGFNQWDEEWELGIIQPTDGQAYPNNNVIRAKNYIPCVPNADYYFKNGPSAPMNICFYDSDKNFISAISSAASNTIRTTPNNCRFIRFSCASAYGTTYNNDICINISDPSKNGTYEPYKKHSYALDSSLTLRGVPKLVDNKIKFDGDVYESDGKVTRRYGVVDLGTLNWAKDSNNTFYASSIASFNMKGYASTVIANAICSKYAIDANGNVNNLIADKTIAIASSYIRAYDSAYTSETATTFKTAMSGVMLVYELVTPTEETAQPYTNPQRCAEGGTEEYVSTSIVPVGHESEYYENIAAKVEGLPYDLSMIAPIENGTTASKAYSVGQYFLHNDQFCKAKTAIASGATFTLNTNYEVTTVANELYTALH